jgi:hypothetical protein
MKVILTILLLTFPSIAFAEHKIWSKVRGKVEVHCTTQAGIAVAVDILGRRGYPAYISYLELGQKITKCQVIGREGAPKKGWKAKLFKHKGGTVIPHWSNKLYSVHVEFWLMKMNGKILGWTWVKIPFKGKGT